MTAPDPHDDRTTAPQAPTPSRRTFLQRAGAGGAALVAAPSVLAACGEDGGGDPAAEADYEQGSAALKVEQAPEIEGVLYPEGYQGPRARELEPFGDGTTEFRVLGRSIPDLDYATNYYAGLVEEKTGVKVSYLDVPLGEDGQTKVNAILSAGDLPDAMMTGMDLFTVSQVAVYGQQGLFQPLDRLIDENAPNIRDMFDTFPDMRSLFTAPDGRMYAVPSMNDCYHCKTAGLRTWYNSDWLAAVGADVPQSLEEFDALLESWSHLASRPADSLLGVTTSTTVMNLCAFFLGSFLEVSLDNLLLVDGKVSWVPLQEGYREGAIWLQEQFAAKHLDPAMFSLTDEQLQRLGDGGEGPRFGIALGGSQGSFSAAADPSDPRNVASIMKPLPPMAGPGGVRTCDWDWYQIGSPNFVITNACEDPVTMIRWADHQFELGLTTSMGRGEQGVGWDWAAEGTTGLDGAQAVYEVIPGSTDLKNQGWWEWGPFYKSMGQRHGEALEEGSTSVEPTLYEAGRAYEPYRIGKERKVPPLAFDLDQSAQIGEIRANLDQHLAQGFANFATGKADASKDADWTAFTEQFSAMGLDSFLAIQQEAYDQQS
ncbi:twin-arginine translocation signal domain-containing protein [Brachybacterium hainanense]|uniref:Twin-arginine translocation signal domain-containing protein n=1 Tax=Brachybacterium hainanense TaxID=1541174 RepID=A0ABV6RCF2_9MICO